MNFIKNQVKFGQTRAFPSQSVGRVPRLEGTGVCAYRRRGVARQRGTGKGKRWFTLPLTFNPEPSYEVCSTGGTPATQLRAFPYSF